MPTRQIIPRDDVLPSLILLRGALAESDANYAYDVETDSPPGDRGALG